MGHPPQQPPIGLHVSRTAKVLSRAFGRALAQAGGSEPVWLILLALKRNPDSTQRRLADELEIREATLTHHLNGMERDGLITRRRAPENRRVHRITLTDEGQAAFLRLRAAAAEFDRRLRSGISGDELAAVRTVLHRLAENADGAPDPDEAGRPPCFSEERPH
ncbi:MarR family winged helix-turn-helix transcriptional regulator [Nocardiopsis suaedae]|uniref:MarR family winged helix-turn-helix transcriptional regulator n=1 Tax=Nocardiopsis suaedae TaxID=3018444 RepID=A0ABT4TLX0_9ACTN|nr:MarR family winged helix-turn-helix transcriptional regulator [Nocardiopsis suaedae]MDA2805371.1 MarR family winged helix-turn-helix transcriptional regulator [Nocardiopsis suaedae]